MDTKKSLLIYVVEDNKIYNYFVCEYLKKINYLNVKSFLSGKECLKTVSEGESPDIVIQDYFLDDSTGIEVMLGVKKHSKKSEFIFLTVNGSLEEAVNTVKLGAYDYILKDNDATLKKVVSNIHEIEKLIELQKRNKNIWRAKIISVIILVLIVLFAMLQLII
ncbi:MAG: response regulator [Draconibacterium sp.]|nr:response regulator [Draconibacterium sp.]